MRIDRIQRTRGTRADRLRIEARATCADGAVDHVWFEVPERIEGDLHDRGDPWAAALLPLAFVRSEPLEIDAAVDETLLEHLRDVQEIWSGWHPDLAPIPIVAPVADAPGVRGRGSRDAAFFSGGVDSFFTVLRDRHTLPAEDRADIRELVTVWGFDIPLSRPGAFDRIRERHQRVARRLEVAFLPVATNLRQTLWAEADWATLAHGAGFAGIGHLLSGRFSTVRLAASSGYRDLRPWGSHPHTDPLFSSSRLTIVHDAPEVRRLDKIAQLVHHPIALENLRVCWRSASDRNCGRCIKCLRTLAALELLGMGGNTPTFPANAWSLEYLEGVRPEGPWDVRELRDLQGLAAELGRWDVQTAIETALNPP